MTSTDKQSPVHLEEETEINWLYLAECKAIPDLNEAPTNTDNVNATVLIQDSIEDPALGEDSDGASVDAWEIEHKMGPSDSEFDHANDGDDVWEDSVDNY